MKSKLIEFPPEILDALAEYKKTTGVSASDYIRNATCRRMLTDKIIYLKIIEVEVESKNNGRKKKELDEIDAIESNKFCDKDTCEIPIQLPEINKKNC
jgi:hypothetical protein